MKPALLTAAALALTALAAPRADALCLLCSCDIDVDTALAFGNIDPLLGANSDAVANIHVDCVATVSISATNEIELTTGASGAYGARTMSDGLGHTLPYNLYLDAAHSIVWGDGSGISQTYFRSGFTISVLSGYSYNVPIYGRVRAADQVGARQGSYSDSITATIIF